MVTIRIRGKKKKITVRFRKGKFVEAHGSGRAKSFKRRR
ncbi:hypothetical protein LCGC14_2944860 [marine sediment metagenome]|uniref:Uncharacterized protein n=1 Tax=marine sediment metagenome TaxID=412755 RepID=A0A0F8ZPP2_9ZZZZ